MIKWKWCIEIYCYHYYLILQIKTSESDNKSVVDQTVITQVVIAAGAITTHVHNLSTYGRVWVTDMFQKGLEFVTALFE